VSGFRTASSLRIFTLESRCTPLAKGEEREEQERKERRKNDIEKRRQENKQGETNMITKEKE
jgi:hypothetical protein